LSIELSLKNNSATKILTQTVNMTSGNKIILAGKLQTLL